ncbi:related to AIF1 - mitochondrial cell death effector [Ustilago trichophora]|uniref:Related to AIF1 - mitochondrial cell death effector n=1 Tax=Ustilago trichophora TaxID=86804 RepID=A0A5C3DY84_9BASI|nr:related to AIF1 - mitochondrial cell death effector [Ustilago trichophora]
MTLEQLKNVVVVGAASAGLFTAQSLAKSLPDTHRVVLIEANPVAYWSIGALRAAVQPGFEDKIIHDLTNDTVFGANTRHVVLAGTRVVDLLTDGAVVNRDVTASLPGSETLKGEGEGEGVKTKVQADKVVLAVGADYGFPSRISPSSSTKDDVLREFQQMQKEIAAAQEILVIGGGPTGVEFVGEVLDEHPNKVVTLLTRGPGLVTNGKDSFAGLSSKLLSQLQNLGVRVILNDSLSADDLSTGPLGESKTFTTEKGQKISADYLMLSSGGKPSTGWIRAIDSSIIDPDTSLITVTPTFSIASSSPRWANYYALGDAASTPGPKTSYIAQQHGPALAHNIVTAINAAGNTTSSKLKKAGGPPGNMIVVPLGKSGGASYLMFFSVGGWLTSLAKGKTLFVDMFHKWFQA